MYEPQISLHSPSCVGELSLWHVVELLSFAGIGDGPVAIDSFYKYSETYVGPRSIPSCSIWTRGQHMETTSKIELPTYQSCSCTAQNAETDVPVGKHVLNPVSE